MPKQILRDPTRILISPGEILLVPPPPYLMNKDCDIRNQTSYVRLIIVRRSTSP